MNRDPVPIDVESLEYEGRGVARVDGKVAFVRGGLPGEHVVGVRVRSKPRFDVYETQQVVRESVLRVQPKCPHFGVCGGCSMQHVDSRAQVAFKQRVLEDNLKHLGHVQAATMLAPIEGPFWGYRHRARLTVRHVAKKGGVLVGFHERGSSFVADMQVCMVLPPRMSALLMPLRSLVGSLSIRDRLPQIEMAIGDARDEGRGDGHGDGRVGVRSEGSDVGRDRDDGLHIVLVLRVLDPPTDADRVALARFADEHRVEFWLQPKGPDTIVPLDQTAPLFYDLPEFGIRMPFAPTDFTQVNAAINAVLVRRAVGLLDPQPDDRVVDFFCGLGNFTLPLATRSATVHGIEGSKTLVARGLQNARANAARLRGGVAEAIGLPVSEGKVGFSAANLFEFTMDDWDELGPVDRVLIDPPRDGALALAKVLATTDRPPQRIVYVSCNPATLARDANILVNDGGWTITHAGVVNMFPQTSHVESIAVFEAPDAEARARRVERRAAVMPDA